MIISGNENLHLISTGRGHKLSIFLEDFDNVTKYANYSRFMLGDEHHKYPVTVSGFIGSSGCEFKTHFPLKKSKIFHSKSLFISFHIPNPQSSSFSPFVLSSTTVEAFYFPSTTPTYYRMETFTFSNTKKRKKEIL